MGEYTKQQQWGNAMQRNEDGTGTGGETENEKHECTDIRGGSIKDTRSMKDEAGRDRDRDGMDGMG